MMERLHFGLTCSSDGVYFSLAIAHIISLAQYDAVPSLMSQNSSEQS
jgi:hypothetical protein